MMAFSIANLFNARDRRRELEMNYLNRSVSMADLERRQREIAQGKFRGF